MKIYKLFVLATILGVILTGNVKAEVLYTLSPGTTYEEGCFSPCMCPILYSGEVTGTFTFTQEKSDLLFTHYRLDNISWEVIGLNGQVIHKITGEGTYQLGGEFALMHQLTLDISIDGSEKERLDSGLILGGAEFPVISISVARGSSCFDIRMTIKAVPLADVPLIATLENPIDGQTVSGITTIHGWALDGIGITKVELFIDNQFIGNIPYGGTRMDVKKTYPNYPNGENSGFGMIWNYSILSSGNHDVKVRIHNQNGQMKDLDASVAIKKFHGQFVEGVTPGSKWLLNNAVTADGITLTYDIKIEWSNASQGFKITDVIQK